ncbi:MULTISPECIES: LiaF transmembrane domain-containing protein [Olivibacter]|jgi:predicted membrane protein|uniref:LiaF domain-containing protein n=2 Tax=Olivibacter TaxID=376469 RepID=A0ABV6HRK7_9SPHI|nr:MULTISPECIES: LiaF domain-containing protein [Olivibacter]MCL4638358.1 cell wall-active antibiotics response protein [Olivibacter sp. UJ_SKK_5.1]MDM8176167.1 LiaF-related protein [Olivibacter sp. 47]MDX3915863.1 LiaF-related protein [Pseudosphingobacterium sp.]
MNNYKAPQHRSNSGRVWVGLIIIIIGFSMLSKTLGFIFDFPNWLFSWPMWLIVIGLVLGARNNFKKPSSFILILIGCFFLTERMFDVSLGRFFWPAFIILLGCWLIAGRNRGRFSSPPPVDPQKGPYGEPSKETSPFSNYSPPHQSDLDWDRRVSSEADISTEDENQEGSAPKAEPDAFYEQAEQSSSKVNEDYIDSVSIFGQVKKNIYSKNFKGGDIVNIMGGADINLIQADIQHPVILEVVQIFGGTTILVPAHWKVNPEMTAIFGGVEDKRFINNVAVDNRKNLIIKGTSIFGGITIKSI